MAPEATTTRAPVLDPVERVSEVIFGVLMAMSFTGTISVATAGQQEIHTLLMAALGCNIAWGLTDAVMYLTRVLTERHRKVALLRRIQTCQDRAEAHRLIAACRPAPLAVGADPGALDALLRRLADVRADHAGLGAQDFAGAFGVFLLVVLATFPVVLPFLVIADVATALRASNVLALTTLFIGGHALGRYAFGRPWRFGVGMVAIGMALIGVITSLGG